MSNYNKLSIYPAFGVIIIMLLISTFSCTALETPSDTGNNNAPGLQETGDIEPGFKIIRSDSGSTPSYVASLELPHTNQQNIQELKWFVEITVDNLSEGSFLCVGVVLNDSYLTSAVQNREAHQIHSTGQHVIFGTILSNQNIFKQGTDNKYGIILYTAQEGSTATISSVKVYHAWNQKIPLSVTFWNHQAAKSLVALDFVKKDIGNSARPSEAQFSQNTSSCEPMSSYFIEPERYAVGFDINIQSFNLKASRLSYLLTYNDNIIASGFFSNISWHRDAGDFPITANNHQWNDPPKNSMKLYLWVDKGNVTIDCVRFYSGVGSARIENEENISDSEVFKLKNANSFHNLTLNTFHGGEHQSRLVIFQHTVQSGTELYNQLNQETYGASRIDLSQVLLNNGPLLLFIETVSTDTKEREVNCIEYISGIADIEY